MRRQSNCQPLLVKDRPSSLTPVRRSQHSQHSQTAPCHATVPRKVSRKSRGSQSHSPCRDTTAPRSESIRQPRMKNAVPRLSRPHSARFRNESRQRQGSPGKGLGGCSDPLLTRSASAKRQNLASRVRAEPPAYRRQKLTPADLVRLQRELEARVEACSDSSMNTC